MQRDHDWHGVRHLGDLDSAEAIGRRAGQRAVARLDATRPRPGRYPILFDPRVSASLLGHFSSAINAQSVARKTSFLQDQLGEQVFAQGVTIVDDPLRPRGLRSRPFDAEGMSVSRQELVAGGILTGWIAESASARQLGIAPTGHAVRSAGGAPGASPSNLWMEPGSRSRDDLLAAFPEAVLIVELIGHGVNGVTGDYSRGAVGFMVRGGRIAEPVSEITIASNLKDMFATLEPGSDLELRRGIDAPTILIPEMTVGARLGGDSRRKSQSRDLDFRAAVHHHLESGGFGALGCLLVDDAKLHPDRLGADENRLVDRFAGHLRAAEDVDDIDRLADLGELGPDELAMDALAGDLRIDREDAVAVVLEEPHDAVRGAARAVGRTDHADGASVRQKLGNVLVTGQRHGGLMLDRSQEFRGEVGEGVGVGSMGRGGRFARVRRLADRQR